MLHSNQLTNLPIQLNELKELTTLVIAFNRFFELPEAVQGLPALRIFIASGNYIELASSCVPVPTNQLITLADGINEVKAKIVNSLASFLIMD